MSPFCRVLLLAARQRLSLVCILMTSSLVALLWGANIATLGPLVKIVFEGDNLSQYAHQEIAATTQKVVDLDAKIADDRAALAGLDGDEAAALELAIQMDVILRDAYAESMRWMQWLQPHIDRYAPTDTYATLLLIIGLLMLGTAIKLVALMINLLLVQFVAEKTALELRGRFFRKSLHLDLDEFGENGSAALTSRLTNDISIVGGGVAVLLGRMVREPLKLIVCLGLAAYVCPRLLLAVAVITPAVALMMHYLSRAIRRASRRSMEEMSQLYGVLNDAFAGIRIVKAFNTQAAERVKFRVRTEQFFAKSMKVSFYNSVSRSVSELLGMGTIAIAVLAGGYLVINQQTHLFGIRMSTLPLDLTQILMFFGFLIGASDPAKKLAEVWSVLQNGIVASSRVYEVIDREVRVREPARPKQLDRPHREIEFQNLCYRYPSGPMVLDNFSLKIRHGETIALVGPNGCGKSTLISLLCRFDDPQSGRLTLDGLPIDQMSTRDLRRRLALVAQRTTLFDDTIENNIRYGSPGADSHAVVRAAKMAYADDFIRRKTSDGYQTRLGVGGTRLSGGQMQRIALARAFLRNPDVLILDEATSQIDLESEELIHQALAKFLVDRTGIMITHRPTTLALADRIIVMEAGKISGQGRHGDLITDNRFYRSLCGTDQRRAS